MDPRARIELRELLRVLSGQGKAILISTHILTELAEICHAAVIIEHGKILMAGAISDLLSTNVERRTVLIRVLNRQAELYRDLLEMPGIATAQLQGADVAAEINGTDEQRANLEEIFMTVTKGVVQ